MPAMLVAFDVSQLETFNELSDEQQKNTPIMLDVLDVSHPERSSEVSDEQWANMWFMSVVEAVSKRERSASSSLFKLLNRAEQLVEVFTPGSTMIALMLERISLARHGMYVVFR